MFMCFCVCPVPLNCLFLIGCSWNDALKMKYVGVRKSLGVKEMAVGLSNVRKGDLDCYSSHFLIP